MERVRTLLLESHSAPRSRHGWQLDDQTGMTLGLDDVLRCQTEEGDLMPLHFG